MIKKTVINALRMDSNEGLSLFWTLLVSAYVQNGATIQRTKHGTHFSIV